MIRKYILGLLSIIIMFDVNCKNVLVFYPVSTKSRAIMVIVTDGGNFDEEVFLRADEIWSNLIKQLDRSDLGAEDVDKVSLEGVAYTIQKTSNPAAVVKGEIDIAYGFQGPEKLMELNDVNFGKILNKPQIGALSSGGVSLLNQAIEDIVLTQGQADDILVKASGSLSTGISGEAAFQILIEFTITMVIKQDQEVLDPIG